MTSHHVRPAMLNLLKLMLRGRRRGYKVQLSSGERRHLATVKYVSTCRNKQDDIIMTSP